MPEPVSSVQSDFIEWLRTGAYRGVKLGMTRAESLQQLGDPENWGPADVQIDQASIYVWGRLEFTFHPPPTAFQGAQESDQDLLETIYNDGLSYEAEQLGIEEAQEDSLSVDALESFLKTHRLGYRKFRVSREYSEKERKLALKHGWTLGSEDSKIKHVLKSGIEFSSYQEDSEPLTVVSVVQTRVPTTYKCTLEEIQ